MTNEITAATAKRALEIYVDITDAAEQVADAETGSKKVVKKKVVAKRARKNY